MACAALWRWLLWAWEAICGDPRASKRRRAEEAAAGRAGASASAAAASAALGAGGDEREALLSSSAAGGSSGRRRRLGVLGHEEDAEEQDEEKGLLPPPSQQARSGGEGGGGGARTTTPPQPKPKTGGPARVIVMRHGHRQDEADPLWHRSARRPWDPPLSAQGRAQAREAAGDRIRRGASAAGGGVGGGGGGSAAATPVAGARSGGGGLPDAHPEPGVALEAGMRPTVIITSPFLRCVQTSAGVAAALWGAEGERGAGEAAAGDKEHQPPSHRWLADWRFCEVLDPRVLFGGRPDAAARAAGKPPAQWMWAGANLAAGADAKTDANANADANADDDADKAALARAMSDILRAEREAGHPLPRGLALQPRPGAKNNRAAWRPPPNSFPEQLGPALGRYQRALLGVMRDSSLAGETVLVVTHGEALRAAVALMRPGSEVFEVRHTGFVVLEPRAGATGAGATTGGGGGDCGQGDEQADATAAANNDPTPSGSSGSSSSSSSEGEPEGAAEEEEGVAAEDAEAARAERQRRRRSARRRLRRRSRRESAAAAAAAASRAASGTPAGMGGGDNVDDDEDDGGAAAAGGAAGPLFGSPPPPGWRLATQAGEHGVMWFDA